MNNAVPNCFLGLDIGTSSVKGLILDANGRVISQSEAPNELLSPHIGWAEQDTRRWEQNILRVINTCLAESAIPAENVLAAGVSGMVPALILLDEDGRVLRPAIQYNDARAVQEIKYYEQVIGAEPFFHITGASLSVQSAGPKIAWIRKHEPEVWQKTANILGSYDYINYFLTGSLSVERNWALESGLMDIRRGEWSAELCKAYEIPPAILPPIRSSLEQTGKINPRAAERSGLAAGTPLIAGSADHVAAAQAAGITEPGDVLIKFGSSGDILYCTDRQVLDPHFYIDYHSMPGKYLPNGCMATSGSLLKWFVNQFCQQDRLEAETAGIDVYEFLDRQAEKIPPGSAGVIVLPYFLGAKTPLNNPAARGVFYGMTLSHNRYHLYRAVMESVIFGFRDHFQVLDQLHLPIRRVVASEGGARSRLWRQMAADILNQPIEFQQENPGSAFGAAVMAGMSRGYFSGNSLPAGAVLETTFPQPAARVEYEQVYQTYLQLYRQLLPVFDVNNS